MTLPALQLRGISKRFGALLANDGISLTLEQGQVLALLGENGAGKSTLVSILFGHYVADAGEITVFGRPLPPGQPKMALAAGIGMVHQHFTLAERLTVLDNVMLGLEPLWLPFARRQLQRQRLLDTAQRFGLQVDPDALIADLSVGERQRVEILKALVRGARILILDEPTAVLTPQESQSLFASLKALVAEGMAIIFISHKLDEVLAVSDRIAVLRGGKLIAELDAAGASKADLAEAMVGRAVPGPKRAATQPGDIVCRLRGATLAAKPGLRGVDLELRAGEVLAVAGVAGNGQHALADLLHGLLGLDAGELRVLGQDLAPRPGAWLAAGVARIPEDRHAAGVVGDLPLWENALLEQYRAPTFSSWGLLKRKRARAHAQDIVQRFDVRGLEDRGLDTLTRSLSGGNMQKLILGRALTGDPEAGKAGNRPRLIVANQPTWGLDVGAVAYVHQQLLDACAAGAAVLLISEDLDEIFAIADRIAVMHEGRLGVAKPRADWTLARIGLEMAGSPAGEATAHAA
ncbi:ABC transporter ATP-binding protein [Roseateles cavernae]|uniref:ABC transporter ATP-binding protein n=1 Tax=Roseateles cavernae TaxID=3153578 RepID=UPI0032E49E3C